MREYERPGYLTLVSDGERITGAHALGPTRANGSSRRHSPSARGCRSTRSADVIQPFPTFSEVFLFALMELRG